MRENESRTKQIKCKQQSKAKKKDVEERSEENQIKIKNYGSECL